MDLFFDIIPWIWAIFCVLIMICVLTGQFNISNSYWKELGIPYVPRKPFVGSADIFGIKEIHKTDNERYKKLGRLFGSYEGQTPVLLLGDPELVRQVFVKDFPAFPGRRLLRVGDPVMDNVIFNVNGEQWKRIRCIITPTFTTGKIKRMTDIIIGSAKTLAQNFASKNGTPIEARKLYSTFTMDVIASTVFATKIHSHTDPNNEFIRQASTLFSNKLSWRTFIFVVMPQVGQLLKIGFLPNSTRNFFKDIVLDMIDHRRKTGMVRNDFLQLMMDAEKEFRENETIKSEEISEEKNTDDRNAEELGHEENNANFLRAPKITKFLSHDELIAQCVIFFIAGFDATASALTFASRLLALHEDIQEKLREDVDFVLKKYDNKLTYEGIQDMRYLDCVVSETMRIYPPAVRVERLADVDYTLGDTGITIKKGTVVAVPVYALHHDPEFYEDPEKFMPERFMPEEKVKLHPYSYLPFGAGPRNCIAMRFVLMEFKLCLAYIISQFKIVPCEETNKPLDICSAQGLLLPSNVFVRFEKRTDRVFDGLV